jgi:3-oxoacyl-[acyl-carrier-protein] synthase II
MQSKQRSEANDIVITGYGLISPLGHGPEQLYQALLENRSAIELVEPHAGVDEQKWLGAVIRDFDPKLHVQPRKTIKVMCREIQLAFAASMQACKMANIVAGTVEPDRLGTVFSGEIIFSDIEDVEGIVRLIQEHGNMPHPKWGATAMENMHPLWMLKSLPNMAACHLGIALDARGPNNTITTEGTSGLVAMLEAINVIGRNQADVMIIGSSAGRTSFARLLQRYEDDYSRSYADPGRAVRPFDTQRDGIAPAECASTIILERRSHAESRGALILGVVRSTANVFCGSKKRWGGAKGATENALRTLLSQGNLDIASIDHINSAANGTIDLDAGQAQGIALVLGNLPVVSYKGALGDSISGSSIIETIGSLAGMRAGRIAATTNHETTASDCPIHVISRSPKDRTQSMFVKLSNTSAGHCTAVAIET